MQIFIYQYVNMKKILFFICFLGVLLTGFSQSLVEKIGESVSVLRADKQMKHAIMSFYVEETGTAKRVFALNEEIGLAPASTQKIFTSIASFSLLGNGFTYKTELLYDGKIVRDTLKGNLIIKASGDPTFGSWRFNNSKQEVILSRLLSFVNKAGIRCINGDIIIDNGTFSYQPLPGGWIWDDIGNYYGAGAWALNWNENQYDLVLRTGKKEGDSVSVLRTSPEMEGINFTNLLKTGAPGSGDNGYIYLPPFSSNAFVTGTVPAGTSEFVLSGSMPDPSRQFNHFLRNALEQHQISFLKSTNNGLQNNSSGGKTNTGLGILESPSLDSINYWFLKKSINLYGEALVKTIGRQTKEDGSTEAGIEEVKKFWQKNGIDSGSLHIIDGSGLSPQNRVTAKSLVQALQFAVEKKWYKSFYDALPLYNGMKMKSGTISGCKAFAGYHTTKEGKKYSFAIILNNYGVNGDNILPKIFKVLDTLK